MRRWYCNEDWNGEYVRMQLSEVRQIPRPIAELAHEEYARGHRQSFERLHERGGFSQMEIIALLADYVARLKADQ